MNLSSISVVIPVYQCAERLPAHSDCLRMLSPMVHELIWVITESPDGSHQVAREAATKLGGQVLDVPRGLYQAWNSGIARATGEFIYISTVGDTITLEGLNALSICLHKNEADVVFSPPIVLPTTRANLKRLRSWTVFKWAKILQRYAGGRLPKEKAFLLQILSGASGLLGSCASCLFRASLLQSRPFPSEYHHYGDTAWTFRNLPEISLAFHTHPVARFIMHDEDAARTIDKGQIYHLIKELGTRLQPRLTSAVDEYVHACVKIDLIRDPKPRFGWWWILTAWKERIIRNRAERFLLKELQASK